MSTATFLCLNQATFDLKDSEGKTVTSPYILLKEGISTLAEACPANIDSAPINHILTFKPV